ncbi:unnamed protein product [Meganyctiphanes norvegica]|uniref:E3 ubiquitin-protein ligase RNF25 n=1 Tax=Meganyctiphanes norvegica TaxID=48144 RepID=A0AAV2R6I5_MEGNR
MASNTEAILEEIEALQAIMMDEVIVHYGENDIPNGVECTCVPATAQNVHEQHVRVTLLVKLLPEYPEVSPEIQLRNPRGVDDDVLQKIHKESQRKCEEYLGSPVIYELIEVCRENLTENNTPSCPCAICLYHFTDDDIFTKTNCYHYFHSYCLGRYIKNCQAEAALEDNQPQPAWMTKVKKLLVCPVCRDPVTDELNEAELLMCPPPEDEGNTEEFDANDPELVSLQQQMSELYIKQKEKGGIIDLEEEKNKFLLSSNTTELCPTAEEEIPEESVESPTVDTPASSDTSAAVKKPQRGHQRTQGHKGFSGSQKNTQSHQTANHHNKGNWKHNEQGGDGRPWSGGRGRGGGRGGGRGRGAGAGRPSQYFTNDGRPAHYNSESRQPQHQSGGSRSIGKGNGQIIGDNQSISSEGKSNHMYDNGYNGTSGNWKNYGVGGRRDYRSYENESIQNGADNYGNERGGGRRGRSSRHGQRSFSGRGRGRGPPPGLQPSSMKTSFTDTS